MAITKAKKGEILSKLDKGLADAGSVVFVNFHGLSVGEITSMRRALRESGVSYFVAKKTLVRRALAETKTTGEMPAFPGELALAWSADPLGAAKGVYEFAKTREGKLSLVGGIFEGAYLSQEAVMSLATIPSREVLLGKFVGMLSASMGNVVRAFNARAEQMEKAA